MPGPGARHKPGGFGLSLDPSGAGPAVTFAATTFAGLALLFVLTRRSPRRLEAPLPVTPVEATDAPAAVENAPAPATTFVTPKINRGPPPGEANIPRWLRPSVREARGGNIERRRADWD